MACEGQDSAINLSVHFTDTVADRKTCSVDLSWSYHHVMETFYVKSLNFI